MVLGYLSGLDDGRCGFRHNERSYHSSGHEIW